MPFTGSRLGFVAPQVRHFDTLAEKEAKLVQVLQRNIRQSAQGAAGSQAGKAQPSAPGPTAK